MAKKLMEHVVLLKILMKKTGVTDDEIKQEVENLKTAKKD